MSEEMTIRVVNRWFGALASGDHEGALACLDDNVHWINSPDKDGARQGVPGLSAIVPWLGDFPNKAAVIESFDIWGRLSQVQQFQLLNVMFKGDEALAMIHEAAVIHATGLSYDIEFIQRIRVANEKIVFWKSYWDTAKGIVAFRGDMKARLLAAAKANDVAEAELVLPFGANPNLIEDGTGQSVLMLAAARGHVEMVNELLKYGANPNLLDARAGTAAIHKACQGGHLGCVRALIQGGAFIDLQTTGTGHTPLVEAIWFTSDAIVEFLLGRNARVERTTYYGFTIDQHIAFALMANKGKDSEARLNRIKQLVEARRAKDEAAQSNPLLAAAHADKIDDFRKALAEKPNLEAIYPVIGTLDDGHTALLIAARNGNLEMVQELIAAGANVNAVEPVFGAVPLHKATYNGHEKITEALTRASGINLNYQGPSNGYTPLLDALWHGYAGCARILLAAGARKDIAGYDGLYPIDMARNQLPGDPILDLLDI